MAPTTPLIGINGGCRLRFSQHALVTDACDKLELRCDERTAEVKQRLRLRLKDGGFGLKSAVQTSPAAYTASVAAARDTAVFAPFCDAACPLQADTLLHGWLQDSLTRLREAALGPELESKLLPASASSFFSFYASAPSALSSSLQSSISALANNRDRETAAQQLRPQDGGRALAHFTACSALHASAWKRAVPLSRSPRCSTSSTASLRASTSAWRLSAATTSCRLTALFAQKERTLWRSTHGTGSSARRRAGGRSTLATTASRTRCTALCC